jgi:hypothetical protein
VEVIVLDAHFVVRPRGDIGPLQDVQQRLVEQAVPADLSQLGLAMARGSENS